MAGKMDVDEKLKAISLGGCWFAENTTMGYDSYAEMREWEYGPYRYLCSKDVTIMDPSRYEFFNLNTKKGYLIPGGAWYSPSSKRSYDSLDACSQENEDCQCICPEDYKEAFRIEVEEPNRKSEVARSKRRDLRGRFSGQ